jgi:hypothetical protein
MRKRDELNNPAGCMARAADDEMTFVLLGRDAAAPETIRYWIARRIELGKNQAGDAQIVEAEQCAQTMEREGATSAPVATHEGGNTLLGASMPRPWTIERFASGFAFVDATGFRFYESWPDGYMLDEEEAEIILTAVNAHDGLVADLAAARAENTTLRAALAEAVAAKESE